MPTNLYGLNDNYDKMNSHVIPGLIAKFYDAKINNLNEVIYWGDGSPLREFLFVDDLADLCVFLMNNYNDPETINAGTGKEITIKDLTKLIADVVGYNGKIVFDKKMPNVTPRKLLDISKTKKLGWNYKMDLTEGLKITYNDYLKNIKKGI